MLLNLWIFKASAMRPLTRSPMPLFLGVLSLVKPVLYANCQAQRVKFILATELAFAAEKQTIRQLLQLSVRSLVILIGRALRKAVRNAGAQAALLLAFIAANTQRVARSMATKGSASLSRPASAAGTSLHMQETRLVSLEGLVRFLGCGRLEGIQIAHIVAARAPAQARGRDI